MRAIDNFCGMENGYNRTITLRNRLIPIGKTKENIESFLPNDRKRAESYPKVKEILDRYHRLFIEIVLNEFETAWDELFNLICEYKKCKDKTEKEKLKANIEKLQAGKRKEISGSFKSSSLYENLSKSKQIIEEVKKYKENNFGLSAEDVEDLNNFDKFNTYFVNYCEIRNNLYKDEANAGEIGFRIVNENFNRFVDNIILYNEIKEKYSLILDEFLKINPELDRVKLDNVFSSDGFNEFLTQNGIDDFNKLIGGLEAKACQNKKQGLNELINLYNQQHPENKIKDRMNVLYKQILSDMNQSLLVNNEIKDTNDCYDLIKNFKASLENFNLYNKIIDLFKNTEKCENLIYVSRKNVTKFSQELYGKWNFIYDAVLNVEKSNSKKLTEKKEEDLRKKIEKRDFSLAELKEFIPNANCDNGEKLKIDYFDLSNLNEKTELINKAYKTITFKEANIQEDENTAEEIKNYLDAELALYHYVGLLEYDGEENKDSSFYEKFDEIKEKYSEILFVYNKVRNFVTKKASEAKKVKLNFNCPTLANGWDKNTENEYNAIILRRNGLYYLGIYNPKNKPKLNVLDINGNANDFYEKMEYKQITKPSRDLVGKFFPKGEKNRNILRKSDSNLAKIFRIYEKKNYDKSDLKILIDFYKDSIKDNKDWDAFNFVLKSTDNYNNINEFYSDIEKQNYKISFVEYNVGDIDKLVEDDKLLLFQIYNKDFAKGASGKKNLHTMYFENLFSNENLKEYVLKLNGGAELFLRDIQLKNPVCHKKDSILVNKVYANGDTIPQKIYTQIYEYLNGNISVDNLDSEAKAALDSGKIIQKKARFDITKDRRFTETQYFFHCPITLNYKATGVLDKDFNKKVRGEILKDETVKIIGLDRGERNLIYLSLINQKGEILKQKSLNVVHLNNQHNQSKVNYQEKLTTLQGERQEARKNWKKINNIKELKAGYLSAVVHEIAEMMIKENAMVVMEDLNFGFKHYRAAIEKQIYQKFENMLLEKLNYLVEKDKKIIDKGGVLDAYQLVLPHKEVSKVDKQSGWVFYIPSSWTSKIDTTTGFVDLFDTKGLTNREKKIVFFKSFNKIYYDNDLKCFVYDFNYSKVPHINIESPRVDWKIYSKGERLVYKKKENKTERVDITKELCKVFDEFGVNYLNGQDIRNILTDNIDYKVIDAIFYNFKYTLQMRNSVPNTSEDYLISPVMNSDGGFFDTREEEKKGCDENGYYKSKMPVDADANGAYHIALKGLYLLKNGFNLDSKGEKIEPIKTYDWLKFVQDKEYLK